MANLKGAGRPPKVIDISTGKIGKEKRLQRARAEEKLKVDREELSVAPDWLSDFAKEEYERIVEETSKIPILDNLDKGFLAIYADNYDRYVTASKVLQKTGNVINVDGRYVPSPYLAVLTKAAKEIKDASRMLGLALTDRLRLIVPKAQEDKKENKYLKYLKG